MHIVPTSLRTWFKIHFVVDIIAAVPLFFAPRWTLGWMGIDFVDPLTTRIVAAALFGIGITSLLTANETIQTYRSMLTLKVIWSFFATIGILWSIVEGYTTVAYVALVVFLAFHLVWLYYWRMLR